MRTRRRNTTRSSPSLSWSAQAYSDTLKEIATLRQTLRASQDQLNRTVLTSPMRGIVNNLNLTTIGGVVRPGEQILEIIPLDEELFVEARVAPENIANLKRGQAATIKLTTYDYTIYGTLKGHVDFISADTFKDERTRSRWRPALQSQPARGPHRPDPAPACNRDPPRHAGPGRTAHGGKTVLQYLLKPLYKSQEAFREP